MPDPDSVCRQPDEQWWCINGAEILAALERAHTGDDPGIVYLELIANSDIESPD